MWLQVELLKHNLLDKHGHHKLQAARKSKAGSDEEEAEQQPDRSRSVLHCSGYHDAGTDDQLHSISGC